MEKTVRYSRKREAILAAIRSTKTHPTAEWIYQTLKPTHPDLSLGTVYRNLGFFLERGDIKSVGVVNGQERYDGDMSPHSHFICKRCGAVYDLPAPPGLEGLDRVVGEQYGFTVDRCELTLRGLCAGCAGDWKQ
jgi:Fur family peroxide stress response transcriptional regulator